MGTEGVLFHKIGQSLGNLSKDELRTLEKQVWDTQLQMPSNPEFKGKQFSAEYTSDKTSQENLSFDTIRQSIENLNPAEIMVLHDLIVSHLAETWPKKEHISASWGTTSPFVSLATNMGWTPSAAPTGKSNMSAENTVMFQEFVQLIEQIKSAKADGEPQKASTLLEEAMEKLKQTGIPDFMLERMREIFG